MSEDYFVIDSGSGATAITQSISTGTISGAELVYTGTPVINLGEKDGDTVIINPRLYFKYVKTKLTRSEKQKLNNRLKKLTYLLEGCEGIHQKALIESLEQEIVNIYRQQEASVCGYDQFVLKKHIEKFRHNVKSTNEDKRDPKCIVFAELEKFPRPIPKPVREIIKEVKDKSLFDELWVLFFDVNGKAAKTNKDRIREKDPILFGKFATDDEKFFFITDWEDEVCDLRFDEFVESVRAIDDDYVPERVKPLSQARLKEIRKDVQARSDRYKNTNPGNYRALMSEEDKKPGYFKRLFKALFGK